MQRSIGHSSGEWVTSKEPVAARMTGQASSQALAWREVCIAKVKARVTTVAEVFAAAALCVQQVVAVPWDQQVVAVP